MKIESREYKLMLHSVPFTDIKQGLAWLWQDIQELCDFLKIPTEGEFDADDPKERRIAFYDSQDLTIRQNGLLLRRRSRKDSDKAEYTLKLRSPDRYLAGDPTLARGSTLKFEEDIAAPFVSRFSQSLSADAQADPPADLGAASRIFPALAGITNDGAVCSPKTPLYIVNGIEAYERVYKKPLVRFDAARPAQSKKATVALILWSKGKKGRVWAAELSFRYADQGEVAPEVARNARDLFSALQRSDLAAASGAMTKTQLIYLES